MIATDAFVTTIALDDARAEIDPSRWCEDIEERQFVERFLVGLKPQEERVLRLRFGIGGVGEHSLTEIGEELGVTRSRVSQIEEQALRRLRHRARYRLLERMPDSDPQTSTVKEEVAPLKSSIKAKPATTVERLARKRKQAGKNMGPRRRSTDRDIWVERSEAKADERKTQNYRKWIAERDAQTNAIERAERRAKWRRQTMMALPGWAVATALAVVACWAIIKNASWLLLTAGFGKTIGETIQVVGYLTAVSAIFLCGLMVCWGLVDIAEDRWGEKS